MDFRTTSLTDLAGSVRTRTTSARELTTIALDRIAALNPRYNAFVAVDPERALADAAALDEAIAKGGDPGPLAGIPLAVKDNHDAVGFRTTHGAPVLADAPPSTVDSPFVARLRAAGCVIVGKTNMPEFAWSSNTSNALFGPTVNPFNPDHGPGGSSGGSAAALAAGMVPLATGSDGGGSIRLPSACCGLSGMKPSLGRVPGGGPTPQSWIDLSTSGPMARRIGDVVTALDVAVGPDPTDLRSLPRPEASWLAALDDAHVPMRVAWAPTLGYATVDAEVLAICELAVEVLESFGAEVTVLDTVFDPEPVSEFVTLMGALPIAHDAAVHVASEVGRHRPGAAGPRRRRPIVDRRAVGTGLRSLPHDEPRPGRPVPRGADSGHPDGGRRGALRRHGAEHDQRRGDG